MVLHFSPYFLLLTPSCTRKEVVSLSEGDLSDLDLGDLSWLKFNLTFNLIDWCAVLGGSSGKFSGGRPPGPAHQSRKEEKNGE